MTLYYTNTNWVRLLLLWIPFILISSSTTITKVRSAQISDWFGTIRGSKNTNNNNTTTASSIYFPKIQCSWTALRIGSKIRFDVNNVERYHHILQNDSVMELAQTGSYYGPDHIEEYIKFAYPKFSPYVLSDTDTNYKIKFLDYTNGLCSFLILSATTYTLDPNTTNATSTQPPIRVAVMFKVYVNKRDQYLSRMNIYYTNDFLRVYFDKFLNSDPTRKFICNVIEGPCSSILNTTTYANNKTCTTILKELPTADGTNYYVDGKSQGCRALHAVFAETNPNNHCAHLSFTPLKDPAGNIKCQTSKGKLPSELFTEKELQSFKSFAESEGIDPIKGHTFNE